MRYLLAVLAATLVPMAAPAADVTPLAKNPFVRPQLVALAPAVAVAPAAAPLEELEVRAVLLAGESSLVDIGGRIMHVGEETDGYKLISVSEDGALFEHGGSRVHIPLQARKAPEELADALQP